MQPIYFPKAGKIMFNKYVNGIPVRSPETSVFRNGAVVSITPNVTINTTPLPDGNSDWDAAEPVTGREGTIAVELSFMPPELYAFLMGTTVDNLQNTPMPVIDHEITIPEASPFEVSLGHTPDIARSIMLVDMDASAWSKTAHASTVPSAGEFTISADVVKFNSSDAGKPVFLTYDYTAQAVKSFGLPKSGDGFAMECVVSGEAMGEDESTPYDVAVIVDRCKATGTINPPPLSRNPAPQTITLKVLKPRGTNKAVDFRFAPRS